jgi:hypothetical protein
MDTVNGAHLHFAHTRLRPSDFLGFRIFFGPTRQGGLIRARIE